MTDDGNGVQRRFLWLLKNSLNRVTLRIARSGRGPFSLVRHVGSRSGRTYETPVILARVTQGLWPSSPTGPAWTGTATSWPPAAVSSSHVARSTGSTGSSPATPMSAYGRTATRPPWPCASLTDTSSASCTSPSPKGRGVRRASRPHELGTWLDGMVDSAAPGGGCGLQYRQPFTRSLPPSWLYALRDVAEALLLGDALPSVPRRDGRRHV
jgi:hypothetical protein